VAPGGPAEGLFGDRGRKLSTLIQRIQRAKAGEDPAARARAEAELLRRTELAEAAARALMEVRA
jgi:hypothetical protein